MKSVKFQGDTLNVCDFIRVFEYTTNHNLNNDGFIYNCKTCLLNSENTVPKVVNSLVIPSITNNTAESRMNEMNEAADILEEEVGTICGVCNWDG